VDGALKVQKLPFLAELEGQQHGLRVAHFPFIRYYYGPYSETLKTFVANMQRMSLVNSYHAPTEKGRYILDYAADAIREDSDATTAIELLRLTGKTYGRKSGTALKERVYGIVVPIGRHRMPISRVPHSVPLLDPTSDPALRDISPLDEDTTEELLAEIRMPDDVLDRDSPGFKRTIREALKRAENACS
jgi:hypothetical protein